MHASPRPSRTPNPPQFPAHDSQLSLAGLEQTPAQRDAGVALACAWECGALSASASAALPPTQQPGRAEHWNRVPTVPASHNPFDIIITSPMTAQGTAHWVRTVHGHHREGSDEEDRNLGVHCDRGRETLLKVESLRIHKGFEAEMFDGGVNGIWVYIAWAGHPERPAGMLTLDGTVQL